MYTVNVCVRTIYRSNRKHRRLSWHCRRAAFISILHIKMQVAESIFNFIFFAFIIIMIMQTKEKNGLALHFKILHPPH